MLKNKNEVLGINTKLTKDLSSIESKKILHLIEFKKSKMILYKSLWGFLDKNIERYVDKISDIKSAHQSIGTSTEKQFQDLRISLGELMTQKKIHQKSSSPLVKFFKKMLHREKQEKQVIYDTLLWFEKRKQVLVKKIQKVEKKIGLNQITDLDRYNHKRATAILKRDGTLKEAHREAQYKAIQRINKMPLSSVSGLKSTKGWWFALVALVVVLVVLIVLFYVVKVI